MKCKNCRDWVLLVIRILIGALFIMSAIFKFTDMSGTASFISTTWLPAPLFLAWASAIVEIAGGLMLILGVHACGAAVILAVYLVVVTFTFHNGLSDQDQMIQFFKNLAIIGGLLGVYVSGGGKFTLVKCKCCQGMECNCK